MSIEIEAKLKITDLAPTRSLLGSLSAQSVGILRQRDTFFDKPDHSLYRQDSGLRLREQSDHHGQKFWLCFKGPRQASHIKQREEIELPVTDPAVARAFIEALGFISTLVVEKTRELFRLDGCDICLDNVSGLGTFVEIEGPSVQKVDAVTAKLGLTSVPHCTKSYAALIAEKEGLT